MHTFDGCGYVNLNELYQINILDFDGDIVISFTMISNDINKIIKTVKDSYSSQGFYYEISKLVVGELPIHSDLL